MPMAIAVLPRSPARSFALGALAWGLGLFALLRLPWIETHGVLPVTRIQGQLAATLSGVTALPVDVTLACSGTDVLAMCLGAILAYPARWRMRLAGATGGLVFVLAVNVVRIATLGRAVASPSLFDTLHLYVWPAALALSAAAYVFLWMRAADAGPGTGRAGVAAPTRTFVLLAAALIVLFALVSPLYLESAWVLAVAGAIAKTAAAILRLADIAALATGNLLVTARGGITVTQECISTPLIPVYLAAVLAYVPQWRRRAPLLAAVVPIFFALGVARLLLVAVPAALIGSPLFFIHAFYQLVTGAAIIVATALWQRGAARGWRYAAAGLASGALVLACAVAVVAGLLSGRPLVDPQGATALLPAFQIALFIGLWIAAIAPARRGLALLLLAGLAVMNAALFAALDAGGFAFLAAHVAAVRAWALILPIALVAALRFHAAPRA